MRRQSFGVCTVGYTLFVRSPTVIHILSFQDNGAESVKYEWPPTFGTGQAGAKRRGGSCWLTRPANTVLQGSYIVPDEKQNKILEISIPKMCIKISLQGKNRSINYDGF